MFLRFYRSVQKACLGQHLLTTSLVSHHRPHVFSQNLKFSHYSLFPSAHAQISCLLVPVASECQSSRARVDFDGLELDKSFVERSKESLDPVAPDLVVADVIQ